MSNTVSAGNSKKEKAKRKAKAIFLNAVQGTPFQFMLYRSYWHARIKPAQTAEALKGVSSRFLAQKPNYGAGIGHQMSNWNTARYFADVFNLEFAHFPFSSNKWEAGLGLGEHEPSAVEMYQDRKVKKIQLPVFDSGNKEEIQKIAGIVNSYTRGNILFLLEQDQGYKEQRGVAPVLSKKFFEALARKTDKLVYEPGSFNIALHIRRGDIVTMRQANDSLWEERWLDNNYYRDVLEKTLSLVRDKSNVHIYLFSQGKESDFPEFTAFDNLHTCLDMNAYDSFVHMVHADVLLSSKSSFSYKPALLSKGIKICPENFWHKYPDTPDFILTDDAGQFSTQKLAEALAATDTKKNNIV